MAQVGQLVSVRATQVPGQAGTAHQHGSFVNGNVGPVHQHSAQGLPVGSDTPRKEGSRTSRARTPQSAPRAHQSVNISPKRDRWRTKSDEVAEGSRASFENLTCARSASARRAVSTSSLLPSRNHPCPQRQSLKGAPGSGTDSWSHDERRRGGKSSYIGLGKEPVRGTLGARSDAGTRGGSREEEQACRVFPRAPYTLADLILERPQLRTLVVD